MALIAGDGIGYYAAAQVPLKWTAGASQYEVFTTGGRANGPRLRLSFGFFGGWVRRIVSGSNTELIVGVRFKPESFDCPILGFKNIGTNSVHVQLMLDSAGRVKVNRNGVNGTLLGTGATPIIMNGLTYIEARVNINDTTGSVEVRLNGSTTPDLLLTGIDTQQGADPIIDMFYLGGDTSFGGAPASYCDFYLCDTTGSSNNTFLGDIKVSSLIPIGDGFYQAFTPSSGTTHHHMIDEIPPTLTDYLSSATTGQKESVTLTSLGAALSIKAIQVHSYLTKSDAGSAIARQFIRTASTDYNGNSLTLSTDPLYVTTIYEQNPNTTAAWGLSEVNTVEIGLENIT